MVANVRFQVLCSHILAALVNAGERQVPGLAEVAKALHGATFPYSSFPPPAVEHPDIVWAGLGFLLGHELGHILKGEEFESTLPLDDVPKVLRPYIESELDADRESIRALSATLVVDGPTNTKLQALPFLGAELTLRTAALLEGLENDASQNFDEGPQIIRGFSPPPSLRWQSLRVVGGVMGDLGLIDEELLTKERARLFTNWREIFDVVRESI